MTCRLCWLDQCECGHARLLHWWDYRVDRIGRNVKIILEPKLEGR
jgi:hypothetical protein